MPFKNSPSLDVITRVNVDRATNRKWQEIKRFFREHCPDGRLEIHDRPPRFLIVEKAKNDEDISRHFWIVGQFDKTTRFGFLDEDIEGAVEQLHLKIFDFTNGLVTTI